LFSSAAIFFPYKNDSHSFDIETERFYKSNKTILFVDKAQNNRLSGVIINKDSSSGESAKTYSGNYSVSEDMILTLQGNDNEYIVEKPNPYYKFFNFFIKISSFIAKSVGEIEKSDLKALFFKSFAIIITISTISLLFSTGKWPLINYPFSQAFVICFIWFNYYIQKFPLPQLLQSAENLIPFESGLYYFAYIVISFSILLIKILSLRVRK